MKLKTCPFCGGNAEIMGEEKSDNLKWIECVVCEIGTKYTSSPDCADIIKQWNARIKEPSE